MWAGAMAQVVEHLSSKCKALRSNPTTTKKKKPKKNQHTLPRPPKFLSLVHVLVLGKVMTHSLSSGNTLGC
jgi:hypothetical protein